MGAGISIDSKDMKLSFVAMAPMISIKNITQVFSMEESLFSKLQDFIDYVDFSIENFKFAAEIDLSNKGAFQAR